jgi:D-sedoheptulose 7-phosphate isomerase
MGTHCQTYLQCITKTIAALNLEEIETVVKYLLRVEGRVFFIGVGGSAATCAHAVNDFRKLCNIEAYTPTDSVAELTARTNDNGWASVFRDWLHVSRITDKDILFVFSVGGGDAEHNISCNITEAIRYAKLSGAVVLGVVGRNGGDTFLHADACILVPSLFPTLVTPITESLHTVILHLLVSHPDLQANQPKWESL